MQLNYNYFINYATINYYYELQDNIEHPETSS